MKLVDFFARVGPFLEGKTPLEDALAALHGDASSEDARRLAIYGRFCRTHREEALALCFERLHEAIVDERGARAWQELVAAYFHAHPMHHSELLENGRDLPQFLLENGHAHGLAKAHAELADLEWWEWKTLSALDDPGDADPDSGITRLGATVELRPYENDWIGWLEESPRAPLPIAGQTLVLFWRDRDRQSRKDRVTPIEMAVLKTILDGAPLEQPPAGVARQDWRETIDDLRAAGIVLGARRTA